jgi:hypothetical protein
VPARLRLTTELEEFKRMNLSNARGNSYRGRVLISLRREPSSVKRPDKKVSASVSTGGSSMDHVCVEFLFHHADAPLPPLSTLPKP